MPNRAFIPGPLAKAQPRVYKSFRARQIRGLLMAAGGAGVALLIAGAHDLTGYMITFMAAVPGFAYGYFEPEGKPVEYWLRVVLRYHLRPRVQASAPAPGLRRLIGSRLRMTFHVINRAWRMRARKEAKGAHGR